MPAMRWMPTLWACREGGIMPVRSKMLLAGAAGLVGLCLGSTGCHTLTGHDACCTAPPGVSAPGPVVGYTPAVPVSTTLPPTVGVTAPPPSIVSIQRPVRRPMFGRAPEGPAVNAPTTSLKPFPPSALTGKDNSTWSPVQRVSAQAQPGEGGLTPVASMDKPTPLATVPVTTGSDPAPLPVPVTTGPEEPLKKPEEVKAAAPPSRKDILPAPKKQPGYPELPPVGITHPVEAPREFAKRSLSAYIIEPPDVLQIDGPADLLSPDKSVVLTGPALVRPDGTIGLGTLGSVFVAGLTLDQAKERIAQVIRTQRPNDDLDVIMRQIKVDVAAFNSKFYYIISDGAGFGAPITRVSITGNETVLDALSQIQGLPAVASKKKIWLARATPDHAGPHILPIDYCGVVMRGSAATNYQLFPGDRLYIESDRLLRFNSNLGKVLSPIERILGVTLLGSGVVNSIRNGGNQGNNNNQR
jgi:polysaccharide export outer membrane protein